MRPPGLEVEDFFVTGAHVRQLCQRRRDKGARGGGVGAGVEERVDVRGEDVDDGAEQRGVGFHLQHVERLGGGDGAGVAGGLEGAFRRGDELCELRGGAEVVEDGFVADDDHFHGGVVAVGPRRDVPDLLRGGAGAGLGDVDPQDEFEVVGLGGGAGVLEAAAVGAVEADGGEAFRGDEGDVDLDGLLVFASAAVGVGRVGHAPLGAGDGGWSVG